MPSPANPASCYLSENYEMGPTRWLSWKERCWTGLKTCTWSQSPHKNTRYSSKNTWIKFKHLATQNAKEQDTWDSRSVTAFSRLLKCRKGYSKGVQEEQWGQAENVDYEHGTDMVPVDQSYDFPKLINFLMLSTAPWMHLVLVPISNWNDIVRINEVVPRMSPVTGRAIQQKYKLL